VRIPGDGRSRADRQAGGGKESPTQRVLVQQARTWSQAAAHPGGNPVQVREVLQCR